MNRIAFGQAEIGRLAQQLLGARRSADPALRTSAAASRLVTVGSLMFKKAPVWRSSP